MPDREVLVLQHVESEHAGTLRDHMKARNIRFRPVRLFAGETPPDDIAKVRAALIMGGPMNVDEEAEYPWLGPELVFLKKLIAGDVPCLGICLGAQLLAKALGARVMKAPAAEIGWGDVRLTEEGKRDALLKTAGAPSLRVLQWHEDTFEIPRHGVHLATSALVPNQAFRFGNRTYGFQFHIEVDETMLKDWFGKKKELPDILKEHDSYREKLSKTIEPIYKAFFSL